MLCPKVCSIVMQVSWWFSFISLITFMATVLTSEEYSTVGSRFTYFNHRFKNEWLDHYVRDIWRQLPMRQLKTKIISETVLWSDFYLNSYADESSSSKTCKAMKHQKLGTLRAYEIEPFSCQKVQYPYPVLAVVRRLTTTRLSAAHILKIGRLL